MLVAGAGYYFQIIYTNFDKKADILYKISKYIERDIEHAPAECPDQVDQCPVALAIDVSEITAMNNLYDRLRYGESYEEELVKLSKFNHNKNYIILAKYNEQPHNFGYFRTLFADKIIKSIEDSLTKDLDNKFIRKFVKIKKISNNELLQTKLSKIKQARNRDNAVDTLLLITEFRDIQEVEGFCKELESLQEASAAAIMLRDDVVKQHFSRK